MISIGLGQWWSAGAPKHQENHWFFIGLEPGGGAPRSAKKLHLGFVYKRFLKTKKMSPPGLHLKQLYLHQMEGSGEVRGTFHLVQI